MRNFFHHEAVSRCHPEATAEGSQMQLRQEGRDSSLTFKMTSMRFYDSNRTRSRRESIRSRGFANRQRLANLPQVNQMLVTAGVAIVFGDLRLPFTHVESVRHHSRARFELLHQLRSQRQIAVVGQIECHD